MATDTSEKGAAEQLAAALRALHEEAGAPSMRLLAERARLSRTSVNDVVRGVRVPSKELLFKIVDALSGDQKQFETLWEATQAPTAFGVAVGGSYNNVSVYYGSNNNDVVESPATQRRGDVSVFLSYARVDDDSTYNRISKLARDVASTYESLTGLEVGIFQDTNSIALGEDWKDRIRLGLESSSIFLAFVSPAYLRSVGCREEFTEFYSFLQNNASTRLVLPLLFSPREALVQRFEHDDIWAKMDAVQVMDVSSLRIEDPGTSSWLRTVHAVASRIADILSEADLGTGQRELPLRSSQAQEDDDAEAYILQRFADLETRAPEFAADLEILQQLVERLGKEVELASRRLTRAQTFNQKLSLSNRLAFTIEPIAKDMTATAARLRSGMDLWAYAVRLIFQQVRGQGKLDPETAEFLTAVESLAKNGMESLGALEPLIAGIESAKGLSKRLTISLVEIQESLLRIAEMRGSFGEWLDEIEILRERSVF